MKKIIAGFLISALWTAQINAQNLSVLNIGDRVRVTSTNVKKLTGRIDFVAPDTIGIFSDTKSSVVAVQRSSIRRVDLSLGKSRAESVKTTAMWGGGIGAVSGAISLGAQHKQVGTSGSSIGGAAALGAFSGAIVFGFVGAVFGAFHTKEKWKRVR